jgi:hypothetical protein
MLRPTMTIRTLVVLAGIGAAIAAAEPAAAQSPCIPGWYYNPAYGCIVGDADGQRHFIPPHHLDVHPYGPSSGFSPHNRMAGGGYVPERGFSSPHAYVPHAYVPHAYVPPVSSSSGFSMSHSGGGFQGGSLGGGSLGHGGFGGGSFGGGGHGR